MSGPVVDEPLDKWSHDEAPDLPDTFPTGV